MKWFIASIALVVLITSGAYCEQATCCVNLSPARPAKCKVLFLVGGPVHDNPELYPMLKKVLEDTGRYAITVSDDRDSLIASRIKDYGVVLVYTTGGALTADQEKGLVGFVEGGKGLVGIHSATDSFKNSDAYWKLMCGRFNGHGGGEFKVKITARATRLSRA